MADARPACPVARVEVIPLAAPLDGVDQLDPTAETVLVILADAEGREGVGEADAPPSVVRAFLEMPSGHLWSQGVGALLVGADPLGRVALWSRLYEATIHAGRRGLGFAPSREVVERCRTDRQRRAQPLAPSSVSRT